MRLPTKLFLDYQPQCFDLQEYFVRCPDVFTCEYCPYFDTLSYKQSMTLRITDSIKQFQYILSQVKLKDVRNFAEQWVLKLHAHNLVINLICEVYQVMYVHQGLENLGLMYWISSAVSSCSFLGILRNDLADLPQSMHLNL